MKTNASMIMNERGQMTIEMILLATVLLSITITFTNFMKSNSLVADLVEGPWQPIQGMIEDGVWAPPKKAIAQHPSQKTRHSSNVGNVVPPN